MPQGVTLGEPSLWERGSPNLVFFFFSLLDKLHGHLLLSHQGEGVTQGNGSRPGTLAWVQIPAPPLPGDTTRAKS